MKNTVEKQKKEKQQNSPKIKKIDEKELHRLYGVLDTLPAHILLIDENFNILLSNKTFRDRFGEVKKPTCYEHLGKSAQCENCETYKVFQTKMPRRWEWIGPDGREYNVYDFLFKDSDGTTLVLKMGWDITERKRAEKEMTKYHAHLENEIQERTKLLVDSEERFRLALKNSPVSVAVQDIDLKYVWSFDGKTLNSPDVIGKTDYELLPKEEADYFVELKRRAIDTQKEVHEQMWITRDGKKTFYDIFLEALEDENGNINGLGITAVDLTQMKLAEEAVLIAKDDWERTFDSVPDLISIIDKDHKIIAANKAMAKSVNLKPEQTVGLACFSCFHKGTCPIENCPHSLTMKDGKQHIVEIHEDTLNKDFLISTSPLFDSNGEMTASVHVARDITERKKSEMALKNLVTDKEILLREVHHRVKNNLQILYSLISMQARRTENQFIKNALEDSQSRIKSMALINEILYKSENISNLDISRYLNELVSYLRETYRDHTKKILVTVDIDSMNLSFDAAISCGLIVNELVSNSLKYAFQNKDGGTVSVKLKNNDYSAELSVEDDGVGLPKTLDIEKAESLGLQLVSSLTKQLDGTISIDSDNGTKFKIVFPI